MCKTVFVALVALLTFSSELLAEELEVGKIYRIRTTIPSLEAVITSGTGTVYPNSKFIVLKSKDADRYLIQFTKIYKPERTKDSVNTDSVYILPKKLKNTVEVEGLLRESLAGLSAGPLVVPFKYRLDDRSLSGDAEVGIYAGMTFEPFCTTDNWCFRITPLVSAGISQVSIATDSGETENHSAATIAAGLLITNWANINIGIIYGQDRIGDKNYQHEGKGWLSFMIGWQL